MDTRHLAITSIPMQPWGQIYDSQTALKKGTIFQDLDMPFYAADNGEMGTGCCGNPVGADPEQREREEKMMQIYQVCFVVDDLRLYLDTHPQDGQALDMLKKGLRQRGQLLEEFARKFFPLTMDCMAGCDQMSKSTECYCWQAGPMPWEGACV